MIGRSDCAQVVRAKSFAAVLRERRHSRLRFRFLNAEWAWHTSRLGEETTAMPQSNEEEERSFKLLCDIQQELASALNSLGGQQSRGALDNYYFHSADHVNRVAEGFIFLRKSGRIDASKLLVRPLIETMFRVEAIQTKQELFYRIAYSETIVEDPKWIGSAASRAGATFDEAAHSKGFEKFKEQLRKQLPNVPLEDKYISVWEIAEAAGMAGYYDALTAPIAVTLTEHSGR